MSNPVFQRGFAAAQPSYATAPQPQQGYDQFQGQPYGGQPGYQPNMTAQARPAVMTMDDVITKTAITMGVLVLSAGITYALLPPPTAVAVGIVGALAALIMGFFVMFRSRVTAPFTLIYAALEGLFIGAISRVFEFYNAGIVVQAVLATFVVAGMTLFVYKFFNIRVGQKFRKMLTIGIGAYVAVMLLNFVLSFANINLGLYDKVGTVSTLGVLMTAIGTILAVLALVNDFDFIERGIEAGIDAKESWRAAYGLTVTMVWLYIQMLRIISYFRN